MDMYIDELDKIVSVIFMSKPLNSWGAYRGPQRDVVYLSWLTNSALVYEGGAGLNQ
jgi:hypothetical protein